MKPLEHLTESLQIIRKAEEKRQFTASQLQEIKHSPIHKLADNVKENGFLEEKLCFPVESAKINGLVAGVDSGFITKNFFSFDLTFVRAVAVLFDYTQSSLDKAHYIPSFYSFPEIILDTKALLTDEIPFTESIIRLMKELDAAKISIEKFNPNYCFLDGSIIPQYTEKPRDNSHLAKNYNELINSFHSLYKTAEENNCTLISCVEDSRGTRLIDLLKDRLSGRVPSLASLPPTFDVVLLDFLLKEGERTTCFNYSDDIKNHAILKDFKQGWAEKVKAFYLKPVKYDKPLRVEFLSGNSPLETKKKAEEISSIVFTLSSLHKAYAYPSILIEADFRARLKPEEIEVLTDKIIDKLGMTYKFFLRRNIRPF